MPARPGGERGSGTPARFFVGNLAPDALSDFVLLAEAHLDDEPGNAGALILLDLARWAGVRVDSDLAVGAVGAKLKQRADLDTA